MTIHKISKINNQDGKNQRPRKKYKVFKELYLGYLVFISFVLVFDKINIKFTMIQIYQRLKKWGRIKLGRAIKLQFLQ